MSKRTISAHTLFTVNISPLSVYACPINPSSFTPTIIIITGGHNKASS